MGGMVSDGNCADDGACREGERCTCRDCWPRDDCAFDACIDDGECAEDEGCVCADCARAPECESYCVPCSEFLRQLSPSLAAYPPKSALCEPESAALYDAFEACACQERCVEECGDNLCAESVPDADCTSCSIINCGVERQACADAVRPDILCNPVTGEPCREGEACDRLQPILGTISGFVCFPGPNDVALCETCSTNRDLFCSNTLTCVAEDGSIPGGDGACGRYCCMDEDCGTGTCVKGAYEPAAPDLGVCAGGMGSIPACEVPDTPPSRGSCVQ